MNPGLGLYSISESIDLVESYHISGQMFISGAGSVDTASIKLDLSNPIVWKEQKSFVLTNKFYFSTAREMPAI